MSTQWTNIEGGYIDVTKEYTCYIAANKHTAAFDKLFGNDINALKQQARKKYKEHADLTIWVVDDQNTKVG